MEISKAAASRILELKKESKQLVAVGTTCVRALETWAVHQSKDGFAGDTDLFIFPPYRFRAVDKLITNFHIPKSSLLLLVAAFLGEKGEEKVLRIYQEAVREKYRFYSYGDCMLIQ